jgi:transporter family protein
MSSRGAFLGVLIGLLCALTWAIGSIMMKELSQKLDPFTLNAPRSLIAGLFVLAITFATGRNAGYSTVTPDRLLFLLGSMAVGGGLGDAFYVSSMARLGVSRAFPIASSYPALTLLFAGLFLREHVQWLTVGGLALVLGGIFLISRQVSKSGPSQTASKAWPGIPFALLASLCWAISMLLVAPGIQGLDAIMVASFRTPALALMMWGIVAARRTWPKLVALSRREWVILLVGGLIGWGLGSVLFLLSVSLLGATRAAILTSTSPLFALPFSVIVLREKVTVPIICGTLLTVTGVALVA